MKYVYIISHGQSIDGVYNFYRREVYSSEKKAQAAVNNILECNKAYDVERDDDWDQMTDFVSIIDYKSTANTSEKEVKYRLLLEKLEVR